jgi:NADPH2:quinone reductase
MKAIRVQRPGGPEVLKLEEVSLPAPEPGQAVVRLEAIGVNFIDVYFRTGLYQSPVPPPFTPGQEGAGTVSAVGEGVSTVAVGERVAYTGIQGSYAEFHAVPAERLVKLPKEISAREGAAALLQGMTAHYLTSSTFPLKPGDVCLVHAAAGGVGLLLCQMAKLKGATVIGTVSTEAKAALAREAGADHVIRYTEQDFEAETRRVTGGRGVDVVYDSVGKTTFDQSLNCIRRRGMMVLFGQSSGPVPPFDLNILNRKGSLFITRPTLAAHIADRAELEERSSEVFHWIGQGKLKLRIGATFPLAAAADAHRALEGRKTTGKVLLIPGA